MLVVALFANSLQSRLTGISIQSQREQAESQLRANMFNSLISPIAGSQKDGMMSADREVLLTELLALNFHENFELKPLMEDAGERLVAAASKQKSLQGDPREPLWSIARRISERQKAAIAREWTSYRSQRAETKPLAFLIGPWRAAAQAAPQGCEVNYVTLDTSPRRPDIIKAGPDCQIAAAFTESVELKSSDGNYTLRLIASKPDWVNQTVRVSMQAFLSDQEHPTPTDYSFFLSWFDLPLTDNTLLPDGNRFAVHLRTVSPEFQKVMIGVLWFPKGYFTPRERPLNYSEVQELLGRKLQ